MKKIALLIIAVLLLPVLLFPAASDKRLNAVKDRKGTTSYRISYLKLLLKDKSGELPPAMLEILKNRKDDVKVRIACVGGLDTMEYKEAVPELLRIVQQENMEDESGNEQDLEEDYDLRIACAKALAGFDDKEVATELGRILGRIQDARGGITDAIVTELMNSKFKNDENVLAGCALAIKHRKKEVREKVIKILGAVNDKKVLSLLMLGLEDKEPSVRLLAVGYVAKIGGKLVNVTLIDALEEEKDVKVRETIADLLLKIEISPLRQVWLDKLADHAAKEISAVVKMKLKKASDRFKKGSSVIK